MPTPQILLSYKNKDEVESRARVVVEPRLAKMLGVQVKLRMPDPAKVAAQMDKSKKPAEWLLSFKHPRIVVDLRIGSDLHRLAEVDIASVKDAAKRRQVIQGLQEAGVLNAAEASAVRKAFPDPERLKELRLAIANKQNQLGDLVRQAGLLKKEIEQLQKELKEQGG